MADQPGFHATTPGPNPATSPSALKYPGLAAGPCSQLPQVPWMSPKARISHLEAQEGAVPPPAWLSSKLKATPQEEAPKIPSASLLRHLPERPFH